MTVNNPIGTKERVHLAESLMTCGLHHNSVTPSESENELNCCHLEDKLHFTRDKIEGPDVCSLEYQNQTSNNPLDDEKNSLDNDLNELNINDEGR